MTDVDTKTTFAELERIEQKYIINLKDLEDIKAEIEKHMKPAYLNPETHYVLINSVYLDSPDRKNFKMHIYGANERMKIRYRSYAPDGHWEPDTFLEVKEKEDNDVHKSRIQIDKTNLEALKEGKKLSVTDKLEKLNSPLYTHSTLQRYITKFNAILSKEKLKPVISITYKRLAYGKGALRLTIDTNISSNTIGVLALSTATKIKQAVDWSKVKDYKNKYNANENAVLEIKHNGKIPLWTKNLLDKYNLQEQSFSKYVWGSYDAIKML